MTVETNNHKEPAMTTTPPPIQYHTGTPTEEQLTELGMRRKQASAMLHLVNTGLNKSGARYRDEYEVKQWSATNHGAWFFVTVEIGRKNDEGKLSSVLCRDVWMGRIGKLGGYHACQPSKDSNGWQPTKQEVKRNPLIYGWGR